MNVVAQYLPGEVFADVVERELEDNFVEMGNLSKRHTGVFGVNSISTRQERYGPRAEWYPGCAGLTEPFLTITSEDQPRIPNHGVAPRLAPGAVAIRLSGPDFEPMLRVVAQNRGPAGFRTREFGSGEAIERLFRV